MAQSFVYAYETPIFTSNVNALGVARILEAIKNYSLNTKLYQASTSEMYGTPRQKNKTKEQTLNLCPYAISKLYVHWMITYIEMPMVYFVVQGFCLIMSHL